MSCTQLHNSTQTRSRSLPHAADTKLPAPSYFRCSALSAGVFQWSAYESVMPVTQYTHLFIAKL